MTCPGPEGLRGAKADITSAEIDKLEFRTVLPEPTDWQLVCPVCEHRWPTKPPGCWNADASYHERAALALVTALCRALLARADHPNP